MFRLNKLKKLDWVILTILFVGMVVRLWGIDFCLPYKECRPDETAIVSHALDFFSGDLNPHFFAYPTLYLYILFGFYLIYFSLCKVFGKYTPVADPLHEFAANPTNLYLIDRGISAILGTATIFVVYKLAEYLFGRKACNYLIFIPKLILSTCKRISFWSHRCITRIFRHIIYIFRRQDL